jgi:hypothetical protein
MGLFKLFKRKPKEPPVPFVPFEVAEITKGDYDAFYSNALRYSLIMLITGKRGSGKTALGMRFLEAFSRKTRRKCYAVGFDHAKLPRWLKKAEDPDHVPTDSVVLVDEGAIAFSSRDAMKAPNKLLGKLMAIARHKNLSMILIAQNSAMIDLNVLRLADVVLLKEPSLMQAKFERKAIREMYENIKPKFEAVDNRKKYFYVWSDEFEGFLSYDLPTFWSEGISKSFRNLK